MRRDLLAMLRCPKCKSAGGFRLEVLSENSREILEGRLVCVGCAQEYGVKNGIVDLLYDPPDFVVREAKGLARFADRMRQDGWGRERILALPYVQDGYWHVQAVSYQQLLQRIAIRRGQRLLDVGSNTCWASNRFAKLGLNVIALDITDVELQGLRTAEYFLDSGNVYFERVLGTMFDLPFADAELDYVFCCEVLHHNDKRNLQRSFKEFYRILKPGGQLLIINETMKFPLNLKPNFAEHVKDFEGYEHIYFFHDYYIAAKRAGFRVRVLEPMYEPFFRDAHHNWLNTSNMIIKMKLVAADKLNKNRLVRRLYLAYRNMLAGDVALNLICSK